MIDYFSYLFSEKSKFYPFTFTCKNEHHPYCEAHKTIANMYMDAEEGYGISTTLLCKC